MAGLTAETALNTAANIAHATSETADAAAMSSSTIMTDEEVQAQLLDIVATNADTASNIAHAASEGTDTTAINITTKAMYGNTSAILGNIAALKGWLLAHGAVISGVIALGAAIGVAYYAWCNSAEQVTKRNKEAREEIKKNIATLNDESKEYSDKANKLKDLQKKYSEAVKGSEEYYQIANEIAELSPELVIGYTDEGNAIVDNTKKINEQTEAYKKNAEAKREAAREEASTGISEIKDQIKSAKERKSQAEEDLNNLDYASFVISPENVGLDDGTIKKLYDEKVARLKGIIKDSADEILDAQTALNEAYAISLPELSEQDVKDGKDNVRSAILSYASEVELSYDELERLNEKAMSDYKVTDAVNELFVLDYKNMPIDEAKANIDKYLEELAVYWNADIETLRKAFGFDNLGNGIEKFYKQHHEINDQGRDVVSDAAVNFTLNNDFSVSDYEELISDEYAKTLDEITASAGRAVPILEDYQAAWQKINEEAKNISKGFSKTEMIDAINGLSDGFDKLDDIYADVKDGDVFDFTKLDTKKFEEAFKDLKPEYEEFIETVSSSPNDIAKCQDAFDKLAQAYVENSGILNNLTDDNAEVAAAMLKNMGIANAEEIIMGELALSKEKARLETEGLTENTYDEIYALFNEENASELTKQALAELALQKLLTNENKISTASDLDQLYNLAEAANVASDQLEILAQAKAVLADVESGKIQANGTLYDWATSVINDINNGKMKFEPQISRDFKYDYAGADKSNKSSSGSDPNYKSELEDKLKALKANLDQRKITYEEYYEQCRKLIEDYHNAGKIDDDEYLSEYSTLLDNYLKALETAYKQGSATSDEYLNRTYQKTKELYDAGIIDTEEYWDKSKSILDNYLSYLETSYKKGEITFSEYYGKYEAVVEHFYEQGILDAEEYWDKNKELLDKYIQHYEKVMNNVYNNKSLQKRGVSSMKNYLNQCLKLVEKYYEDGKISAESYYEYLEQLYGNQVDYMEKAVSGVKSLIDAQKEALDKEKEALEKANEERQKAIDLQKALYELNRAENQRTKFVYTDDKGFVYQADGSTIKDAQNTLDDQKYQAQVDAINKQIDALQEYADKWDKVLNVMQDAQNEFAALQQFGDGWKDKVLSLDTDIIEEFKNEYFDACQNQADAAMALSDASLNAAQNNYDGMAQSLDGVANSALKAAEAMERAATSISNLGSGGGSGATPSSGVESEQGEKDSISLVNLKPLESLQRIIELADQGIYAAETLESAINIYGSTLEEFLGKGALESLTSHMEDLKNGAAGSGEAWTLLSEALSQFDPNVTIENTNLLKEAQEALKLQIELVSERIETNNSHWNDSVATQQKALEQFEDLLTRYTTGQITFSDFTNELNKAADGTTTLAQKIVDSGVPLNSLYTYLDNVSQIVGTADENTGYYGESINGLSGIINDEGIVSVNDFTSNLDILADSVSNDDQWCKSLTDSINSIPNRDVWIVTHKIETKGNSPKASDLAKSEFDGTVGNAYSEGTVGKAYNKGKYPGLKKDEDMALRSEFGQPELTIYPNGTYEITDEPTFADLPAGTVIFNEKQTKRILANNGKKLGKSFAGGTILRPLQQGDNSYELVKIAEQLKAQIADNMMYPMNSINKNVEMIAKNINSVQTNHQQSTNIIENVNITCPGITSDDVAKQIGSALRKEFSGMSLNAYQKMNVTR